MEKKIKQIVSLAEELLNSNNIEIASKKIPYLRQWLSYFQHERLIHLIVTVAFSVITILCFLTLYFKFSLALCFLSLLFFIMSGAYIRHYYILENKVQYLYELIDKLNDLK